MTVYPDLSLVVICKALALRWQRGLRSVLVSAACPKVTRPDLGRMKAPASAVRSVPTGVPYGSPNGDEVGIMVISASSLSRPHTMLAALDTSEAQESLWSPDFFAV